jgi:hypothetical protein
MGLLLTDATAQDIQLELIRRHQYNAFDGQNVAASLLQHSNLWQAVMMDRFCFSNPGQLPQAGLIKLRDLPGNDWNVDTLYILTPDVASARQLEEIAEREGWAGEVRVHDDADEVMSALGTGEAGQAMVSIWWD